MNHFSVAAMQPVGKQQAVELLTVVANRQNLAGVMIVVLIGESQIAAC